MNRTKKIASVIQEQFYGFVSDVELYPAQRKQLDTLLQLTNIINCIGIVPIHTPDTNISYDCVLNEGSLASDFCNLLFSFKLKSYAYHYTTLQSLLSILESKNIRLSSLASLNDRSENTVDDIIYSKNVSKPFHYKRVALSNRKFVLSCSDEVDNLNLWRLYGHNATGACVKIAFNSKYIEKNFQYGRVIYSNEILKKASLFGQTIVDNVHFKHFDIGLHAWRNFIKLKDYSEEKEVRLFFKNSTKQEKDKKWCINSIGLLSSYIEVPLDESALFIREIILGPNAPEKKQNVGQFQEFLRDRQLNKLIKVSCSDKDHYR